MLGKTLTLVSCIAGTLALAEPALAQETAVGHGAGTIELRLQSSSTVVGSSAFLGLIQPGLTWAPDSGAVILNLAAGGGYFVAPSLALGLDLAWLHVENGDATSDAVNGYVAAPYVKFVTGMPTHSLGFFAEVSPSLIHVTAGNADANALALTGWLGGHFFVARSAALELGPYVTRFEDLDGGEGEFLLGLRFGLSVYLP